MTNAKLRSVPSTRTPTLDEIRKWPATVSVPKACTTCGISRSHGYEAIKTGEFPFRTIKIGGRYAVITASIIEVLSDGSAVA